MSAHPVEWNEPDAELLGKLAEHGASAVDEAAFREELAERAQDIAAKITRGEIARGLPSGYRFEFAPPTEGCWMCRLNLPHRIPGQCGR